MVKVITRMGLLMMDAQERKERIAALMTGNIIHCDKVGELIDSCKDKCYELTQGESHTISEAEIIQIRWMLTRIDGLKEARRMNPDELAEWVLDLRENGTAFSTADLQKVARALMGMHPSSQ
jgi:hypothetical protein